jgi:hypothetical protein
VRLLIEELGPSPINNQKSLCVCAAIVDGKERRHPLAQKLHSVATK